MYAEMPIYVCRNSYTYMYAEMRMDNKNDGITGKLKMLVYQKFWTGQPFSCRLKLNLKYAYGDTFFLGACLYF